MRLKLIGKIIEDLDKDNTSLNHETYSMILANINTKMAKRLHTKDRFKRLFTFSRVYINGDSLHLYISGEDNLMKDFINYLMFNQMIRIGNKVILINAINPLKNKVNEKELYTFKANLIVNEKENGKVCLSKDFDYIRKRINEIATDKYKEIYHKDPEGSIETTIIQAKKTYTRYKNHYLNSWKMIFNLKGDYELINLIYNVGIGENTASGHGLMWEV